jgi:hypothetical protein
LDEIRNASDIITKTSLIDVYVQTQKTYFAFGVWCMAVLSKKKKDSFCFNFPNTSLMECDLGAAKFE